MTSTKSDGDGDIIIQSQNYGAIRHNDDNDDLETNQRAAASPIIYEQQTQYPIVYSPSLGDGNNDNVQSDISSSSTINDDDDDDDDDENNDDDDSIEIIEQPHRTLGLIFFDFIRCIAMSANVRCLNTQLMPIFMSLGSSGAGIGNGVLGNNNKMKNTANNQLDALSVALR